MNKIDEMMQLLNTNEWKLLFCNTIGTKVDELCYDSIYNRIMCVQGDRCMVNIKIFKELKKKNASISILFTTIFL